MNGLEDEWQGEVQVIRLNIHEAGARELGQRFDFRTTPTFILFDQNGAETWRQVGLINAGAAREAAAALTDS